MEKLMLKPDRLPGEALHATVVVPLDWTQDPAEVLAKSFNNRDESVPGREPMNVTPVDYNAATPSGSLRLDFPDTKRALNEINAKSGDWIWASDGEIFVGAHLEEEPDFGLVATPRGQTLVRLDDYEGADFLSLWRELEQALQQPDHGILEETTVFRLSTVFETIAPPNLKAVAPPGYFPMRRAGALHFLGEPGLALVSLKEAYDHRPNDPDTLASYLEILRSIDSHRAESEAKSLALSKDANTSVFAAFINVWSAAADRLTGPQFDAVIPQILEWFDRFERATGRDQVRAST